ncbi:hypothetical protein LPJ73_005585, partial [Coemansia sp. RSA 2703]
TPMLSNQELQDELALWSNAQFQLEPMTEEPPRKKSVSSSLASSDEYNFNSNQQHVTHQQPSNNTQQQQQQQQAISWDFSMAPTSTDIFNAISSVPSTGQQPWTPITQQPPQHHYPTEQSPVMINGVPMVPLVQMTQVQQQQQQAKPRSILIAANGSSSSGLAKEPLLAPAPSSSQFHRPVIMPKGGIAALSEAAATAAVTSTVSQAATTSQQRTSTKAKRPSAADVSNEIAHDDEAETAAIGEDQADDGNQDNRVRAAEEDKRRRNTAASAR